MSITEVGLIDDEEVVDVDAAAEASLDLASLSQFPAARVKEIRNDVLNGMRSIDTGSAIADVDTEKLDKKVLRILLNDDVTFVGTFAYVAGRNWAMDLVRKRENKSKRILAEIADDADADQEYEEFMMAEYEFKAVVELLKVEGLTAVQLKQLDLLEKALFHGYTDAGLEKAFPDTTPDQRYQWRNRATKLVKEHASPNLLSLIKDSRSITSLEVRHVKAKSAAEHRAGL
ncbi:MAG: hypothetical protein KA035_03375 [Candidatus Levybacteria bacterium]|nr:hypothetical protein [Candidatus Levybacteria bacterium]